MEEKQDLDSKEKEIAVAEIVESKQELTKSESVITESEQPLTVSDSTNTVSNQLLTNYFSNKENAEY